jgi:hypothetical protein
MSWSLSATYSESVREIPDNSCLPKVVLMDRTVIENMMDMLDMSRTSTLRMLCSGNAKPGMLMTAKTTATSPHACERSSDARRYRASCPRCCLPSRHSNDTIPKPPPYALHSKAPGSGAMAPCFLLFSFSCKQKGEKEPHASSAVSSQNVLSVVRCFRPSRALRHACPKYEFSRTNVSGSRRLKDVLSHLKYSLYPLMDWTAPCGECT